MSATRPPVGCGGPGVPKSPLQSVHHLERELVPSTEGPVEKQHARRRHHGYDMDLLGVETTVESPLHGAKKAKPDLLGDREHLRPIEAPGWCDVEEGYPEDLLNSPSRRLALALYRCLGYDIESTVRMCVAALG